MPCLRLWTAHYCRCKPQVSAWVTQRQVASHGKERLRESSHTFLVSSGFRVVSSNDKMIMYFVDEMIKYFVDEVIKY